jgi:hypothetical protein
MTLGLLDLSIVTDRLINLLKLYRDGSHLWDEDGTSPPTFTINVTGLAPDAARKVAGCQLSLYLFHVALDKFHRNTYPTGGSAQRIPEQPLALGLYYLVTASSDSTKAYVEEQQAMSVALKFFHETPRVTATVPLGNRKEELTVTFEPQTVDEIGRLWQAASSPMRLSAVYRASVVFLEPPEPKVPEKVKTYALDTVASPIVSTVTTTAGRATIEIEGAGFAATAAVQLHDSTTAPPNNTTLVVTTIDPPAPPAPGQFRVVDEKTLDLQVPAGTPARGYLLLMRPAIGKPTLAVWLVVS